MCQMLSYDFPPTLKEDYLLPPIKSSIPDIVEGVKWPAFSWMQPNIKPIDTSTPDVCFCCDKVCKVVRPDIPKDPEKWTEVCCKCYTKAFQLRYPRYALETPAFMVDMRVLKQDWKHDLKRVKEELKAATIIKEAAPTISLTKCFCCQSECYDWKFIWRDSNTKIVPTYNVCAKCYFAVYKVRYPHFVIGCLDLCVGSGLDKDWLPFLEQIKKNKMLEADKSIPSDYKALRSLEDAVSRMLSRASNGNNKDLLDAVRAVKQCHLETMVARLPLNGGMRANLSWV